MKRIKNAQHYLDELAREAARPLPPVAQGPGFAQEPALPTRLIIGYFDALGQWQDFAGPGLSWGDAAQLISVKLARKEPVFVWDPALSIWRPIAEVTAPVYDGYGWQRGAGNPSPWGGLLDAVGTAARGVSSAFGGGSTPRPAKNDYARGAYDFDTDAREPD
jgi:hypothetical protein